MSAVAPRAGLLRNVAASAPARRGALALLVVALLLFPYVEGNDADIDSLANASAYAALALGLNVVVGFAGLLDLGYAAFFAIGAYFYGVFTSFQVMPEWSPFWQPFALVGLVQKINQGGPDLVHFTLSFWLALPLAALVAAFFGILFGAPTLRLRGDYLAIVTLGFGEIVPIVARNTPSITNGAAGLNGVQAPMLFGYNFTVQATPYYYVGLALVALLMFASFRLRDSRVGRAWMAVREDETAASAMGVDRTRTKLLAFAIGAAFAGAVGVFYIAKLQTATPDMFGFPVSVMILVMVVLGGMGSVWGVVAGAVLLSLLQSWFLPDLTEWLHMLGAAVGSDWMQQIDLARSIELIFGILLVLMMLFRRDGLIPATRRTAGLAFDRAARAGRAARRLRPRAGGTRAGAASGRRRQSSGSARRHRALRRADRAECGRCRGARGQRGRGDRAERLGQIDAVQRHHRPGARRARQHPLRRPGDSRPAAAPHPGAGAGAHVPEHPPVREPLGARQRADRPARAADRRGVPRRAALAAHPCARNARQCGARATSWRCSATG